MEEKIEWKPEYEIGIGVVDYQHRKLVTLIADLQEYRQKDEFTDDILDIILEELCNYTRYHFSTEEKYMEQLNYPVLEEHKVKHENFVKKIEDLKNRFQAREKNVRGELEDFLLQWLVNHIAQEDAQIKNYVNTGGGLV